MTQNNIHQAIFRVNHAGGSGTCFYLKKYGYFVSNFHELEGNREVAHHDDEKNCFLAKVVVVNPKADLALLRAEGDFSELPEIVLPEKGDVSIGQKVNVAGYPYGMPFTMTEGTVSAPRQLIKENYYIQTDAAVNPGNSGGPMLNENLELVGVTCSKMKEADNMGFGIPVDTLHELLNSLSEVDESEFNVQCPSCDCFLTEEEEYCPSCGEKLEGEAFRMRELTELAAFCEKAIEDTGINPVLARRGYESWVYHVGSSEIRLFVYQRAYLLCTSPINVLPKKDLEPVLTYLLGDHIRPYQFGLSGKQIYISYRIHISDVFSDHAEEVRKNLVGLALKADELDNYLAENFGCEFTEYTKKDAI